MLKLINAGSSGASAGGSDPLAEFVTLLINVNETPESFIDLAGKGDLTLLGGAIHTSTDVPGILLPNGASFRIAEKAPITNEVFALPWYYPPWSFDVKFTVTSLAQRIEIYNSDIVDYFQNPVRHLYWENNKLVYEYKPRRAYSDGRDSGEIALPLNLGFNEISIERQHTDPDARAPWEVYHNGVRKGNMNQTAWGTWTLANSSLIPNNGAFTFIANANTRFHSMRMTKGAIRYGGQDYVSAPGPYPYQ